MNKQFIDGVLEVLRDDERQICKQAANIIGELAAEIDGLQSLNDFQQQQISCMQSEIEAKDDEIDSLKSDIEKMKCCQIQATKSCTNCQSYNAQGEYSKCHLHIYTTLNCLENNFSVWRAKMKKLTR